jgi:lipopolysaccharide transport system ATP-binding protein
LFDENGSPSREVHGGRIIVLRISAEFLKDVSRPILGYTMRDRLGIEISACNTTFAGSVLPSARSGQIYTSDFRIHLPRMAAGSYSIAPAVAAGDLTKHDMCDWIDNALIFNLQADDLVYGTLKMDVEVRNYASGSLKGAS